MRLALAGTALLLCFGLMSCNDEGDSKPIAPLSQACKCKPNEQGAPQLKPQFTDGGSGKTNGRHRRHRSYAGVGHGARAHWRGHSMAQRHYAVRSHRYGRNEHRYNVHEHYRTGHEAWRGRYAHREHYRRYAERERRRYSKHEYAQRVWVYGYTSHSRRSYYGDQQEYSGGPCCHCRHACARGGYERGHAEGYRSAMSINDPAALDPWQGYGEDGDFSDW